MTLEGYLMIFLLILALLKITQTKSWSPLFKKIRTSFSNRLGIELYLFFAISLILGLLINDLIIALIVFNSIVWTAFYYLLRKYNYQLLAWLGLLTFLLLCQASNLNFVKLPHTELWLNSILSWEISLIALLIYDTVGRFVKIIPSLLSWILYVIPMIWSSIYIIYIVTFESDVDEAQLNAIFQTNYFEVGEFIEMFIPLGWIVGISVLLFLTLTLLIVSDFQIKEKLSTKGFTVVFLILIVLINLDVLSNLKITTQISNTFSKYVEQIALFQEELNLRNNNDSTIDAVKKEGNELYVFVIGESLNKHHMGLYGYHRNTTPGLSKLYSKGRFIKFEQAFSHHTHTIPVLTSALTASNQINNIEHVHSPSIIDLLEKADFDTYWISNQVSYGAWGNPVSAITDPVDFKYSANGNIGNTTNTTGYDDLIVKTFENIVSKGIDRNTVIFIHLMGNHVGYYNRYPEQFQHYADTLNVFEFGNQNYTELFVNHYDNSVLYNDKQIEDIIRICDDTEEFSAGLYFSDHGEDVLLNKSHNSGQFTYSMTEIPMIFWASETYSLNNEELVQSLYDNKNKLFSIEYLFDLMIHTTGIESNVYTPEFDISNALYNLKAVNCRTVDGLYSYTDANNIYYHQKRNMHKIDSLKMSDRILSHRVNTIGKLSEVTYEGLGGIEVDLMFRSNNDGTYFEVGHHKSFGSGMKFEDMLLFSEKLQVDKIWMEIKNINQDNLKEVTDRLTSLDIAFGIKERSIIETRYTLADFNQVSDLGFQTSYYIPKFISNLNIQKQKEKARAIAHQVKVQKMTAVSFDAILYPFVIEFLGPLLNDSVIFHTWDLSMQMKDPHMIDKLTSKEYYNDDRLKTILVRYSTNFEL